VTAKAGDMVAYDFQPHGVQFAKPLALRQDVEGTSYTRLEDKGAVEAGYSADPSQLDEQANTARVDEFLPATADVHGTNLYFDVHHFSGYMLSSGRVR
jgi:hypothetical protein